MPQIFQVIRCYKCLAFQVHQTKKSNKWECKLCGEKQSIKRHYGIGTAKDCRIHVQKLNSMRGEIDELKCGQMKNSQESDEGEEIDTLESQMKTEPKTPKGSKWSNYIEERETPEDTKNEPVYLGNAEVVLEIPKKRRKQFNNFTTYRYSPNSGKGAVDHNIVHNETEKRIPAVTNIPDVEVSPPFITSNHIVGKENSKPNLPCTKVSKLIQPVINKNSKWAEYVEDEEPDVTSSQITHTQTDLMFSQCDDSELDSVLDI